MGGPELELRIKNSFVFAIALDTTCFRNVSQRFANRRNVLSDKGSKITGGRYNYKKAYGVLYLSCDIHTCIEETTRATMVSGFDVAKALPRTIIGVRVKLQKVLDLTDNNIRRRIGITKAVLVNTDWEYEQNVLKMEAITQSIGRFVRNSGFEAVVVPSIASKGKNLNVFLDNLMPSSEVSLVNKRQLPM